MRKSKSKYIPYGRQSISNQDIAAVVDVLKSPYITQGAKIKEFEGAICKYTGARYAVAVSSGTAALHLACLAAGIKQDDEVITSPITFVASANCVLYCGGRPVFADVQQDTVNIDPKEIEKKITKRTKALIPVHFAGHPCDLEEINEIAKENRLTIIEDAAHALGAEYKGSKIGSCKYSDMTIFSFHPVKSITTGEGGAILTNRRDVYEKLLMFRNHGITKESSKFKVQSSKFDRSRWYYEMQYLGFNYRITDFQCALGISQFKKLDKFVQRRREIVSIYNQGLSKINEIILPKERLYVKSSLHIYYIRLKNSSKRKIVFDKLQKSSIGTQVHYIPVHLQLYYRKNFGHKEGDYLKAEDYYKKSVTIPLYPKIKLTEIKYVVRTLKEILR